MCAPPSCVNLRGGDVPPPMSHGTTHAKIARAKASRSLRLAGVLRQARLRGGGCSSNSDPSGSAAARAALTTDCAGDEAFAHRLHAEETRSAAAQSERGVHGRAARRHHGEGRVASGRSGPPLLATALLAEVESRALCRNLGDRGFEGTGPSADEIFLAEEGDDHLCNSGSIDPDDEFLLGSVGKAIWEGAHCVLSLPRTLAELRSVFESKCLPTNEYPVLNIRWALCDIFPQRQVHAGDGRRKGRALRHDRG